jgi:hypothetical protein
LHIEILVEDSSGKKALEVLVPKILGSREYTHRIHSYKGIGHIPKNLKHDRSLRNRLLLDNLPKLLRGYGKSLSGAPHKVIVVCDLDDRNHADFVRELEAILSNCEPRPEARFCLAIEEGEAWFLGDLAAIKAAYPRAKQHVLATYRNDEICGTWEKLADAVYPGGAMRLKELGWRAIGEEKQKWATGIPPRMNVDDNLSPSFVNFRDQIRSF